MMDAKQFKRFFLVMIIPLTLLGWWIAEDEILIENHFLTECEEFEDYFACSSIQMSKKELDNYRQNSGGVYLWNGARLTRGLIANVVSSGVREVEYKDGALQAKKIVGAGIQKKLNIGMHAGANYSGNGPCTLSPFAGNTGEWAISCIRGINEDFRFSSKSVHDKFIGLFEGAKNEHAHMSSMSKRLYLVAMLVPFVGFVLVSGLMFLLRKLFLFVRYGSRRQSGDSL